MLITRPKFFVALCLACFFPAIAFSQALARPNWAGFVTSSEAWWKNSSVYEIDPHGFGGLSEITQHLDYIHSLGADAILLTGFQHDATHPQSVDPTIGTLDDLDDLIHQTSSRNMRVLIDLGKLAPATDLTSIARYWLNRGVAGFHITGAQQADQLRKIASTYIGQRIVIGDLDPTAPIDHGGPQLLLDARLSKITQLTSAAIRPELEAIQPTQNMLLATDDPNETRSSTRLGDGQHDSDIAKILATILFTNHASALIYYGQEVGLPSAKAPDAPATPMKWGEPPVAQTPATARRSIHPAPPADPTTVTAQEANPSSLLSWYRRLIALHHSNATINSAPTTIVLNHDDQNVLAWVRKPQAVAYKNPAVIIVCNLTAQPVHLSLKDDMQKLHLKGSFLRTILRSDDGMGPMSLDSMTLPPFGIYIGGLGY
jgi:glycosidase